MCVSYITYLASFILSITRMYNASHKLVLQHGPKFCKTKLCFLLLEKMFKNAGISTLKITNIMQPSWLYRHKCSGVISIML